jgi:hypothetical protein
MIHPDLEICQLAIRKYGWPPEIRSLERSHFSGSLLILVIFVYAPAGDAEPLRQASGDRGTHHVEGSWVI